MNHQDIIAITLKESLLIFVITLIFTSSVIYIYYQFDHYDPEPLSQIAHAFLYGVLTPIFTIPLYYFFIGLILPVYDDVSITFIELVLFAPITEEIFKAILLIQVVKRFDIDGPMDGMIYGIALGAGFAMIENLIYGFTALIETGAVRAIRLTLVRGGFAFIGHPIYSGIFGYGLGAYKVKMRLSRWSELHVSIFLHMIWNTLFIIPNLIPIRLVIWIVMIFTVIGITGIEMYRRVKVARKIENQLYEQGYFDDKRSYRVLS